MKINLDDFEKLEPHIRGKSKKITIAVYKYKTNQSSYFNISIGKDIAKTFNLKIKTRVNIYLDSKKDQICIEKNINGAYKTNVLAIPSYKAKGSPIAIKIRFTTNNYENYKFTKAIPVDFEISENYLLLYLNGKFKKEQDDD